MIDIKTNIASYNSTMTSHSSLTKALSTGQQYWRKLRLKAITLTDSTGHFEKNALASRNTALVFLTGPLHDFKTSKKLFNQNHQWRFSNSFKLAALNHTPLYKLESF